MGGRVGSVFCLFVLVTTPCVVYSTLLSFFFFPSRVGSVTWDENGKGGGVN